MEEYKFCEKVELVKREWKNISFKNMTVTII